MSDRNLVTKRLISAIDPIVGAENIVRATIDGWYVVVRKDEFNVGDTCIYFEVDSFIPATDVRFSFLEKTKRVWRGKEGYRLKTIKLRGQISQGLAIPFTKLTPDELALFEAGLASLDQILSVDKWEEEEGAVLGGNALSTFPPFLRKTDQERIQNVFGRLVAESVSYEVTTKMDGSSFTAYRHGDHLGACSRNQEIDLRDPANSGNVFFRAATSSGILDFLWDSEEDLCVQAELCGPGIQKNRAGLDKLRLFIFDISKVPFDGYLGYEDRQAKVNKILEYNRGAAVPIFQAEVVDPAFVIHADTTAQDILAYAATAKNPNGSVAEGYVFKAVDGSHSFKAINNEYLLKHGI